VLVLEGFEPGHCSFGFRGVIDLFYEVRCLIYIFSPNVEGDLVLKLLISSGLSGFMLSGAESPVGYCSLVLK
jgi:hypothetical protein